MNLSKFQKFLVGLFTFIPFVLVPYLVLRIFVYVMGAAGGEGADGVSDIFTGIFSFLLPIMLAGFLSLTLLIFYIIHAALNKDIDNTERFVWIVLFLFVGVIIYPFYLFLRITVAESKTTVSAN